MKSTSNELVKVGMTVGFICAALAAFMMMTISGLSWWDGIYEQARFFGATSMLTLVGSMLPLYVVTNIVFKER